MVSKLKVGVLGATGMVGQRFVSLLANHPWFEIAAVAASASSAGKSYGEAVAGRWVVPGDVPAGVAALTVHDAADVARIAGMTDFVFCAVDMDKAATARLEDDYARAETPVVSNNSAHRWTPDVPMLLPEVNPEHAAVIEAQRVRLGTRRGFVVVKPNCSLQSYVPALHALRGFAPTRVAVCTYQALSGAGKTLASWPQMADNVMPIELAKGEAEKSEREPMRLWGTLASGKIVPAEAPVISAQCVRVPVSDGHLAAVFVAFDAKPTREQIIAAWSGFAGRPQQLKLPSAPQPFLRYLAEDGRPQTRLDRDAGDGQAVVVGHLHPDRAGGMFDWRFVGLSHNTVRGAAGGAVLTAELLKADGWIAAK